MDQMNVVASDEAGFRALWERHKLVEVIRRGRKPALPAPLSRHVETLKEALWPMPLSFDGGKTLSRAREMVRHMRHLPLGDWAPRTCFHYCNYMYLALSHCVETLTGGRWLGDTLREGVWEPLAMRSTYFSLGDALAAPEHFSHGYYWDQRYEKFVEVPFMPLEAVSGAGSVVSTVADYAIRRRMIRIRPLLSFGPVSGRLTGFGGVWASWWVKCMYF